MQYRKSLSVVASRGMTTYRCTTSDRRPVVYQRFDHETAAIKHDLVVTFAHANGFCKEMWNPVIDETLALLGAHEEFLLSSPNTKRHRLTFVTMDLRNHGDSWKHPLNEAGRPVEPFDNDFDGGWKDVIGVMQDLKKRIQGPNVKFLGFGHSMGGACLALAEGRQSGLFDTITLYEPILLPPYEKMEGTTVTSKERSSPSPMVNSTRKRRSVFPTRPETFDILQKRPFWKAWDDRTLRAYVDGGFADSQTEPGKIELKCHPMREAELYVVNTDPQTAWKTLRHCKAPTTVVVGSKSNSLSYTGPPEVVFREMSEQFPSSKFHVLPGGDHFAPFVMPAVVAKLVVDDIQRVAFPTESLPRASPSKL